MRHYFAAWKELLKRYLAIWQVVWKQRHLLTHPERTSHEREFLPAALELEETPVSPLPRVAMGLIISFVVIALLWAVLGKLDVVVTAAGKIVPSDRTKIIQPLETATVKAIYVQDGQQVKAGDILLELDATAAEADEKRTEGDWMTSRLASARALALLKVMQKHDLKNIQLRLPETKVLLEGIPSTQIAAEERILVAQATEFQVKLEKLEAEISGNEAQIVSGREILSQMQETLPIVRERAQEYKKLFDQDYVSKHEYLDKEKERIALEHEATAQSSKLAELESALLGSRRAKDTLIAETQRATRETLGENDHRSLGSNQERIKAAQRAHFMQLRAPVAGKVQQLAVHTVGGVVTPAQPLLTIVPTGDSVEIEAFIQNKDIGFINEGQAAVIKVEAFPYTKFGTIQGRIKIVSTDAVADEKKGLLYSTRVEMLKNTLRVGNKTITLSSGMAVTVEIKTGQRRVIEYFLSPLLEHADESFKER
jgi:hemolysin D